MCIRDRYKCESKEDSFSKIEGYVINNYDFVQNGIKLEYTVDEKLCKEYLRIFLLYTSRCV